MINKISFAKNMSWLEALKEWNFDKTMWCIPKKGTEEYDQVRAIMARE